MNADAVPAPANAESTDKMTDRQVAARVRQRFSKSKRRLGKRVAV